MANASPVARARHTVGHFASTRATEVLALQASPILGCWLGGMDRQLGSLPQVAVLLISSLALTGHIFVFNDWANYHSDLNDPQRSPGPVGEQAIARRDIAMLAVALLLIAMTALTIAGPRALMIGVSITMLSFLYSQSTIFGKATPVAASLNHIIGGSLHFLLGYTLDHPADARGFGIAVFFGLVFAGGHLNQEIRDHAADASNQIRTSAVVFGCRAAFFASVGLFSAAYLLLMCLAALDMLPRIPIPLVLALWSLQLAWSWQALRRGLGHDTAIWLQRRYRMLFASIGLALLVA